MRAPGIRSVAWFGGLGALVSAMAVTLPAQAAPPAQNGKLACEGQRGDAEVYTMNPDGSGVTYLTDNAVRDGDPSWNPKVNRLAFESYRVLGSEAYRMNADGSNVQQLTFNGPPEDRGTDWSPDGKQIVFHSTRDGNFEIYKMNADGTGQTRLTTFSGQDASPAWSPDGTKIIFNSTRDDPLTDIYSMDPDGRNVKRLTTFPGQDAGPVWSPDGRQIAFHSHRDGDISLDIYRMNADGSGVTRLTQDLPLVLGTFDAFPTWSPDGTRIAWTSNRNAEEDYEVYTMNAADGSGVTRVTTLPGFDGRCDWAPAR